MSPVAFANASNLHRTKLTPSPQTRVRGSFTQNARNGTTILVSKSVSGNSSRNVQANFFPRVGRIFRSYTNGAVESAEDPERILQQAFEDMKSDIIRLRHAAAQIAASKRGIQVKFDSLKRLVEQWEQRAELAVKAGDDNLAREALKRKRAADAQLSPWASQMKQQESALSQLRGNIRMLEAKMAEAESKKETLKARAASAKSSKQIQDLLAGLDTSSSFAAFDKMEEKVLALEASAESTALLVGTDSLEGRFKSLEAGDVDDDLVRMKGQLAVGDSVGFNSRPLRTRDFLDLELDALRAKVQGS